MLLIGIVLALILRGIFIALGAEAIARFDWMFYLFGAFLIYTAWKLIRHSDEEEEFNENRVLRAVRRIVPSTNEYHGAALTTRVDGRQLVTPMLIVMVAIGTTDLLFAVDSIPAIFGLTQEPYLVFTANAFALMGLRQLFFLIGGLLDRLVYLSKGLAIILAFIGLKLIFEAMHHHGVAWAPEMPILGVAGGHRRHAGDHHRAQPREVPQGRRRGERGDRPHHRQGRRRPGGGGTGDPPASPPADPAARYARAARPDSGRAVRRSGVDGRSAAPARLVDVSLRASCQADSLTSSTA